MRRRLTLPPGVKLAVRLLVSVSLMLILLVQIDIRTVLKSWESLDWKPLLLVPFFYLSNVAIRATRLMIMLRRQQVPVEWRWLFLVQLKGSFLTSFVPGGLAGDVYRTYAVSKEVDQASQSILVVAAEKAIGLAVMIAFAYIALFVGIFVLGYEPFAILTSPMLLLLGAVVTGVLVFYLTVRGRLVTRISLPLPFLTHLQEFFERVIDALSHAEDVARLVFLSILLQFSIVLWNFVAARAINLDLPLLVFLVTVPIVELLLTVPISISGIGVRDGLMVLFITPFGARPEQLISFSLLVAATITAVRAISGLSFLVALEAKPTRQSSSEVPGGMS